MKSSIFTIIFTVLLIATIPLISIAIGKTNDNVQTAASITTSPPSNAAENNNEISTDSNSSLSQSNSFKIYDRAVNKVITVNDYDFCCGALATETESDIPSEALKAQAIIIHTYYSYLRNESRKNNEDYDFECNSQIWEIYANKNDIKEKWGDTFTESYGIIEKNVKEVIDTFVLYNNKPAMTKYFEISSGTTESYQEIYGDEIPYLINVPSPFDTTANNYKTTVSLTYDEFNKAIKKKYNDYKYDKDYQKNISDFEKNDYGAVLSLKIGNKSIKGKELCNIANLRSNTFELECKDDKYIFTVYGYGENIGLSQYGACKMAEQGSSYVDILQYYFPNTTIVNNYIPEI